KSTFRAGRRCPECTGDVRANALGNIGQHFGQRATLTNPSQTQLTPCGRAVAQRVGSASQQALNIPWRRGHAKGRAVSFCKKGAIACPCVSTSAPGKKSPIDVKDTARARC